MTVIFGVLEVFNSHFFLNSKLSLEFDAFRIDDRFQTNFPS